MATSVSDLAFPEESSCAIINILITLPENGAKTVGNNSNESLPVVGDSQCWPQNIKQLLLLPLPSKPFSRTKGPFGLCNLPNVYGSEL